MMRKKIHRSPGIFLESFEIAFRSCSLPYIFELIIVLNILQEDWKKFRASVCVVDLFKVLGRPFHFCRLLVYHARQNDVLLIIFSTLHRNMKIFRVKGMSGRRVHFKHHTWFLSIQRMKLFLFCNNLLMGSYFSRVRWVLRRKPFNFLFEGGMC